MQEKNIITQQIGEFINFLQQEAYVPWINDIYYYYFTKKSVAEAYEIAWNLMSCLLEMKYMANIYFSPGNTESLEDYVIHLIAGKDGKQDSIKTRRLLGLSLTHITLTQPTVVMRQESGRLMISKIYQTREGRLNHSLVIGMETDQMGRIITSISTMDKKKDKNAALRVLKRDMRKAEKILFWECGGD